MVFIYMVFGFEKRDLLVLASTLCLFVAPWIIESNPPLGWGLIAVGAGLGLYYISPALKAGNILFP